VNARIRNETPQDIEAVGRVTIAAFHSAAHSTHTEQFIVDALRAAGVLTVSLVAELEDKIVGHVAASPISISGHPPGWHGLGPVSVAPERQRRGVGTLLVTTALASLNASRSKGCVVLGDPAYYGRFGFKAEQALVLPGVPPEFFQAMSFGGSVPFGTVSYHQAFKTECPGHAKSVPETTR
jgi:predicted N-acetyltransferase YhbS